MVGCALKLGTVYNLTREKCLKCKGTHIEFSRLCAKKIKAITLARQSSQVQPTGQEMREVMGANRVALGTRQARCTRNRKGEGELTADKK